MSDIHVRDNLHVHKALLDPALPPLLDLRIDLLIQLAHRGGRHARTPQRFRDVLDSPHAHSRQVHLHQRLFHARLASLVALDNRRQTA